MHNEHVGGLKALQLFGSSGTFYQVIKMHIQEKLFCTKAILYLH